MTKTSQTRHPSRICNLAPVAKILENKAGAKARMPDTRASARALRVLSVACVGAMSLTANWTPAKQTHLISFLSQFRRASRIFGEKRVVGLTERHCDP
jgi:hypothetical protein